MSRKPFDAVALRAPGADAPGAKAARSTLPRTAAAIPALTGAVCA